jgi:hypothetical protein
MLNEGNIEENTSNEDILKDDEDSGISNTKKDEYTDISDNNNPEN